MMTDKLFRYPLYSQDGKGDDTLVAAVFTIPEASACWIITEADKQQEDAMMFGWCDLGMPEFAELGYVTLNQILDASRSTGLSLIVDYPDNLTLKEAKERFYGKI